MAVTHKDEAFDKQSAACDMRDYHDVQHVQGEAYSNTKASMKDESSKIVEACFDNTDRYYTQEGYR